MFIQESFRSFKFSGVFLFYQVLLNLRLVHSVGPDSKHQQMEIFYYKPSRDNSFRETYVKAPFQQE